MSYDLAVFVPKAAPSDRDEFMKWYHQQTRWEEEGHDYNDPNSAAPELRELFFELIKEYPPMNGPLQADEDDVDDPRVTDYSIGKNLIYAAFAWSQAEDAFKTLFSLAERHKVGFFDVSSNEAKVWLSDATGQYVCVHSEKSKKQAESASAKWWQFWKK